MKVELNTTRGVITMHLYPCEGKTGTAVYLGGAAGGVRGPANEVYVRLGRELVQEGVTSLRVEYREPGEFEECVVDALAACSFLKGIGATETVIVGHSFGGAVAVKAGELADLAKAVVGMSSQRFGTQDVGGLGKPLLLIHGSRDEILDRAASDDIFERAQEPKQLVILEGAGHGLLEAADDVHAILREYITRVVGEPAGDSPGEAT
jgi:pimeloyl-ACP methyl ester carboxylesterase